MNPPACRDRHGSLYSLQETVRSDGWMLVVRFTRQERYCPTCPRQPYGEAVNGCIFRHQFEEPKAKSFENRRYTRRPYISDEELVGILAEVLLEKGDLQTPYFQSRGAPVSYHTIKVRYGGMERAREVVEAWLKDKGKSPEVIDDDTS